MPIIEVDFETFKEITRRRPDESVSEGDVVKEALRLSLKAPSTPLVSPITTSPEKAYWESEGVKFPVGTVLEHKFRDGRLAKATVTFDGLEVEGRCYPGLSPAAKAITKHDVNGWLFWFRRDENNNLVVADRYRNR